MIAADVPGEACLKTPAGYASLLGVLGCGGDAQGEETRKLAPKLTTLPGAAPQTPKRSTGSKEAQ